jgi:hypothetical protein
VDALRQSGALAAAHGEECVTKGISAALAGTAAADARAALGALAAHLRVAGPLPAAAACAFVSTFVSSGIQPAAVAGGATSLTALQADAPLRALFRAALSAAETRGLLPLTNACDLSDVMSSLDPGWAEARRVYVPFGRLFWAFQMEVRYARLELVPTGGSPGGFALVRAAGDGSV